MNKSSRTIAGVLGTEKPLKFLVLGSIPNPAAKLRVNDDICRLSSESDPGRGVHCIATVEYYNH